MIEVNLFFEILAWSLNEACTFLHVLFTIDKVISNFTVMTENNQE